MKLKEIGAAAAIVAACAGCSKTMNMMTTRPSATTTTTWANAQADIARAEGAGAANIPAGALHLQLARQDLMESRQVAKADANRAQSLAQVASAEAQLALDLTRQSAARDREQQAQAELQKAMGH